MGFDISQYETVHDRLARWWSDNPNSRIATDLIAYSDTQYIFKASLYKDSNDANPIATGFAEERVGSSFINKTSAAENAETSAIGRALANANYVGTGKQRASTNEMQKTSRYETANGPIEREEWKNTAQGKWAEVGKASAKQIDFVKKIVTDAFTSTGFEDSKESWNYIGEWVQSNQPINQAEDLNKKHASMIINDKMKTTGVTKLKAFLQDKKGPDYDPWASPPAND
jgi:hypothetical protein